MAQRYRLKLSRLDFVSPVDTPAQETATVVLTKRANSEDLEFSAFAPVVKFVDTTGEDGKPLGLVFCWAFTEKVAGEDYHDLQGDQVLADDDMIRAALDYVKRGAKTDQMHDRAQDGFAPFVMPMNAEIASAFFGKSVDTSGLMIGLAPSPEVYAKFKSGEYTGVSIDGLGLRTAVKGAAQKPDLASLGGEILDTFDAMIESAKAEKAVRSANPDHFDETGDSWRYRVRPETQFQSDSFRTIALGKDTGVKAVVGKFPDKDVEHIQTLIFGKDKFKTKASAAAWIHKNPDVLRQPHSKRADVAKVIRKLPDGQYGLYTSDGKKLLSKHPTKADAQKQENAIHAHENDMGKRFAKLAVLTSEEDGHQHAIDLDDPACGYRDYYATSLNNAAGSDQPHTHAWTFDAATGAVTIGADSGHTHTVSQAVPPDVLAAFRSDRAEDVVENLTGDGDDGVCEPIPDEKSSGATVVVVAARANSTPTPAAKQAGPVSKENTPMQIVVLTEAQKAHHDKLSPSEQATFLTKSATERDAEVAKAIEADPVVFKGELTGSQVRKSDGALALSLAKQNEALAKRQAEQETEIAKAKAERETEVLKRRVRDEIGHLAGSDDTKIALLKSVNGITDEKVRGEVVTALKAADAAMKQLGAPIGSSEGEASDGSKASAYERLSTELVKFCEDKKIEKVWTDGLMAFAKTTKGAELKRAYDEAE